ncbi:MAG: hypothetical protein F6K26_29015 [Moorea sp. SIO2I5]|nr:hypothetical protein [Moorena sp. SIO2I5]
MIALHTLIEQRLKTVVVGDSRFPIPDSRFPIPDSRFPTFSSFADPKHPSIHPQYN